MRELTEFPITHQEIIDCLMTLSGQFMREAAIGDMRPILLLAAADIVEHSRNIALTPFGTIATVADLPDDEA